MTYIKNYEIMEKLYKKYKKGFAKSGIKTLENFLANSEYDEEYKTATVWTDNGKEFFNYENEKWVFVGSKCY